MQLKEKIRFMIVAQFFPIGWDDFNAEMVSSIIFDWQTTF